MAQHCKFQSGLSKISKLTHGRMDSKLCAFDDGYFYNSDILPCGFFWKHLARAGQNGAICWVPDTLVLNDVKAPCMWVYSNPQGRVERNTYVCFKEFTTKMTTYSSPEQLVVVMKKPTYRNQAVTGNDIKLINTKALQQMHAAPQVNDLVVLQRYIKSSGSRAFICRTVYRANGKSECFIITNSNEFYSDNGNIPEIKKYIIKAGENHAMIVKSQQGKHLTETLHYSTNIVKYFGWVLGIEFGELVADYIKDQMGTWWLINVKAFKINKQIQRKSKIIAAKLLEEQQNVHLPLQDKEKYQKTKTCKYCEKAYLQSELNYKMTIKMIISTDRYLLHRGKTYKWLQRSDLANIDTHSLYQQHRVCERCYKLYMFTEDLMELQCKFAEKLGIPVTPDSMYNLVMSTGSNYLQKQSKSREVDKLQHALPEQLELGPNSKLLIQDNCPIKNDAIISKMVRYRFVIYLVSIDQLTSIDPTRNYFLEYSIVNVKVRYKIQPKPDCGVLTLNRLRVIYAFSHDRKALNDYINLVENLTIHLISESQDKRDKVTWGTLNLQLKDFMSEKVIKREYYKMFNLKGVPWGWGLSANLGLVDSDGYVDTSRMIFKNINEQVYYPENPDYYSCQPLPSEWITLIKQRKIDDQGLSSLQIQSKMQPDPTLVQQNTKDTQLSDQKQRFAELQKEMAEYLSHRGRRKSRK